MTCSWPSTTCACRACDFRRHRDEAWRVSALVTILMLIILAVMARGCWLVMQ